METLYVLIMVFLLMSPLFRWAILRAGAMAGSTCTQELANEHHTRDT